MRLTKPCMKQKIQAGIELIVLIWRTGTRNHKNWFNIQAGQKTLRLSIPFFHNLNEREQP